LLVSQSAIIRTMRLIASILFALLLLLQAQLWFGSHGVFQLWSMENTIDANQARNTELRERNEALHAQVQELKAGEEALEDRARSQLGFIKEGETFYRVIPEQPKSR